MQTILDAMLTLGIELGDSSIKDTANFIVDLPNKSGGIGIDEKTGQLLPEVEEAIEVLWRNPGVQECFGRSNEYQVRLSPSVQMYGTTKGRPNADHCLSFFFHSSTTLPNIFSHPALVSAHRVGNRQTWTS